MSDGIMSLAFGIADDNARSEIEFFARRVDMEGQTFYDTMNPVSDDAEGLADLAVVHRAVDYILARGDVWPWTMKRHIAASHLVCFDDKEAQSDGDH